MLSKFLISPLLIFGLFAVILVLHIFGIVFGWYWSVKNFDNVHHFLGGVWSAAVFFHFLKNRSHLFDPEKSFLATVIVGISFAALTGVAWEFFEFGFDRVAHNFTTLEIQLSVSDTMGDLFFDLFGGLVLSIAYIKSFKTL